MKMAKQEKGHLENNVTTLHTNYWQASVRYRVESARWPHVSEAKLGRGNGGG